MTFLELCQRLRLEAGIAGTGPTTVTGQTGELGRVVEWILAADEFVQNSSSTWEFLQTDFTFSTIATKQNYTTTDVSLTDLASWKIATDTDLTIYSAVSDETHLIYVPWADFKGTYLFGANRTQSGRPTIITVKPNNSVSLWAIPDDAYTVTGEYYKKAQVMSADGSVPLIPSQFHMIIVWKALMYYGAYAGAPDAYSHGEREYKAVLRKLQKDQLPEIMWGPSLA